MPVSTKLQVRRDTAANWTSTNPTLASGEIGFETDTLKFKVGNGSTAWTSLKYSQDASLLNGNASITTLTTTGDINTAGKLNVTASAGDEGGEIFLAKPVTNTSINTGVTIDVYQDRLRFFEQGGSARGYYIDITGGGAGVSTNLVGGGSAFNGGTITNALVVSNTSGVNTSGTYTSTIATGTAPFTVSSTTQVANLNVATSGSVNATVTGTNSANLVYGSMGDNDQFRIQIGATATNAGFVEIATADDGTEPIHVRQYTGVFTTLARTATLLDGSGNTTFPGTVSGTRFISNVATGTAPFTVTSTTQVANLNVAVSGLAVNLIGGTANKGEIVYQSGVNTTAELTAPTTNMSALLYNTSTNAPYWSAPLEALTSLRGYTFTASAGAFTALTNTSSHHQEFSGTSGQTIGLPNTATLALGTTFYISARTLGTVTVNTFGNVATALTMPGGTDSGAIFTCVNTASNSLAGWDVGFTKFSTRTGTGAVVLNNTPTFVSPVLGAATGTSLNVTGQLISTQATGTAPFVVSSTTQVANLNAATASISVNISAGSAGTLPYQSGASTTSMLARTATNNSTLAFNSSTNAPFWIQPTLSNTYYAATTSAQIAGVVSDETGSGALVFGTTPTITPANAVVATSATQAGYIGMPQNSQSGAYTLAAGDAGKHIYYTVTGQTVTIPNNSSVAFQIGTAITFITAPSVSLSIAITTDTLRLANTTTTGTRTLAANGVATAIKVTSTAWIISGNGLT